jgi:hypothetical protein
LDRGVVAGFGAAFEHATDQTDVDGFGVEGPLAGGVDPVGSPFVDQTQQGVDLTHLGPRQRDIQQRRGVGADGGAVGCGDLFQFV